MAEHAEGAEYVPSEIDILARAIKETGEGDMEALWRMTFALPEWYFIATNDEEVSPPYAGVVDGEALLFAFTHPKKAFDFAKTHGIFAKDDDVYLAIVPEKNIPMYLSQFEAQGIGTVIFDALDLGFKAAMSGAKRLWRRFRNERVLSEVDFDVLVDMAQKGEADIADVWEKAFRMGEWYLIAAPEKDGYPLVIDDDAGRAVLFFTDPEYAQRYAIAEGGYEDEESVDIIAFSVADAPGWIAGFEDTYGGAVVFNIGRNRFAASFEEFAEYTKRFSANAD